MSESTTSETTEQTSPGSVRPLVLWMLTTLAAGVLLALLFGSATPRIRLLGLYPLAIGAFVAFGAMALMVKFELKISRFSFVWMILLATATVAGSTWWSWQVWKKQLTREHATAQARMNAILRDIDPESQRQIQRENILRFRETITFPAYLSDRLKAFANQIGRKNVWDSPVPEIIYCVELFLALVGAWVVILSGTGEWTDEASE